jgi:hypothetical protein
LGQVALLQAAHALERYRLDPSGWSDVNWRELRQWIGENR